MTTKEKLEMLNKTTLMFTTGVLPGNLNSIAPDYVYYEEEDIYINVFLTQSISFGIIGEEVFSEKNKAILEEAKKFVRNASIKNKGSLVVFPTLLNTAIEDIVGVVFSNIRILM